MITNHLRVKNVIASFRGAEFNSNDVQEHSGLTIKQVWSVLNSMKVLGLIEAIDDNATKSRMTYRAVRKAEFKFELPELDGVWRDITMRPLPVMQKGRVFTCQG